MSKPQVSSSPLQPPPPPFNPVVEAGVADADSEPSEASVLELENGDRLTQLEFERRYDAMPQLKKAELIKGRVYVGSPVKHKRHSRPHGWLITWLGVYAAATPGTDFGDNGSVRLDDDNTPQPDAILRILTELGGQSLEDDDDYLQGAPELVVEVASSSASYDLHDKKDIYGLFGAREYIVWRTRNRGLDWFRLENNTYVRVEPGADGVIASRVFPGLRLAVPALLKGDLAAVLAELQNGLASPAHAAFVEQLAQRKSPTTDNRQPTTD
ncbi:MAG: Uma2 family endonuclease [Acidobacteria bacterium]|nr:Uma2 family endonuclease [Acidobacteriota bacterium]MBI3423806.1 Uma2 family endonuclease [Acidobacteriota bacterium]